MAMILCDPTLFDLASVSYLNCLVSTSNVCLTLRSRCCDGEEGVGQEWGSLSGPAQPPAFRSWGFGINLRLSCPRPLSFAAVPVSPPFTLVTLSDFPSRSWVRRCHVSLQMGSPHS